MPAIQSLSVGKGTIRFRIALYAHDLGYPITVRLFHSRGDYIVRGWDRRTEAETGPFVVDNEAPLNEPVRIVVEVDRTGNFPTDEQTVTVTSDTPLIGDPRSSAGIPVTIQSWPDFTHERAGKLLGVSDSRYPVIIDGFERAPSSTITLIHNQTPGSALRLASMLEDRSPLRVRPSCPSMAAAWVSARSRSRRRFSGREDSAVVDVIELAHTGMPSPGEQAIGNTLMDLHNTVPTTLAAIHSRWPFRLIDIALEDLTP